MRRLRATLVSYGIEIVSYGKQGLVYKGSERSIRTMIYDFINQNLGMTDFFMNQDAQLTPAQNLSPLFSFGGNQNTGDLFQ